MKIYDFEELDTVVKQIVIETPILDIHTHIYDVPFAELLLWGVDELITYHYLVAEVMRVAPMDPKKFYAMPKKKQANYIWKHLFIENSPVSEACRGVLTCLQAFGLDVEKRNLNEYRKFFESLSAKKYVDMVFETANVSGVVMTNDPFDAQEVKVWKKRSLKVDKRFRAALRLDSLLNDWPNAQVALSSWGYNVDKTLSSSTLSEIRRFLKDWIKRIKPDYMAVSLPPTFNFPDESARSRIIEHCILPIGREKNLPFAMMIGVKKLVNPALTLAGDAVGKSDINVVEYLCANYPENKFMVTMLSRENEHECCIAARKFTNLLLFGCWWYLNNPSLIEEITRMRLELLGTSIIPQHSDARVLDQLVYKWSHSRGIIADVLVDKYADIMAAGWVPTDDEIRRDVEYLFGKRYTDFLAR